MAVAGPNGDATQATYNAVGWPASTTLPDGAGVGYTANSHTSTSGALYKRTTVVGFGRVVSVETGDGATYSTVRSMGLAPARPWER